jgi:phage terminase large subunit GpA-like protein
MSSSTAAPRAPRRGLTRLLGETWRHAGGTEIGLSRLAIDTGYEAPAVYAWARRMGSGQVVAIKGVDGFSRPAPVVGPSYVDATEGGRKIRRGARLWTIAVATFKSETYRFLRLDGPTDDGAPAPAGAIHLPRGTEAEWIRQLVAEQLITVKTRRGFTRLEWQKLRERNEALDCRVYARAVAWIAGIDRWPERKWRELEAQIGVASNQIPSVAAGTPARPVRQGGPAPSASRPAGGRRAGPWLPPRRTSWL